MKNGLHISLVLKNAWEDIYGADVSAWPQGLKDALETVNAGVGLSNFEQNITSALQGLRLDDVTVPAFEAGQSAATPFMPARRPFGGGPDSPIDRAAAEGLIPDPAARTGLSFISSPLALVVPIWLGGLAGRAAAAGVTRAGEGLGLAEEALGPLGTLVGLTAESAGFVGAGNVIASLPAEGGRAKSSSESTFGRGIALGAMPPRNDIFTDILFATLLFGGLRLFGWAGRSAQGLLPATETGTALAKLTGHASSVAGLATMEDLQEGIGDRSAGEGRIYEKLWRAIFLHATIHGVNRFVDIGGVKSEAGYIRGLADGLNPAEWRGRPLPRAAAPARQRVSGGDGRPCGIHWAGYRSDRSGSCDRTIRLMMSGSAGDSPPPERGLLLQYVPGYRGRVSPEEQRDVIARLDELGPAEELPSIGITLPGNDTYIFKGGRKVLSDITDVLQEGDEMTVIHNFPGKVLFTRMTKLGEHVVSVQVLEGGTVPGPRHVTLFLKIRDRIKGGVSVYQVTFPAVNLNDLRSANTVMLVKGVRIRPAFDDRGRLDHFEAALNLRQGLELDAEKLVIPTSVMKGGEENEPEPSNVIDISARLGGGRASDTARTADFKRLFRRAEERGRFEKFTECPMEEAVRLLEAGDPKFFAVVGRRMRNVFNTFITVGQCAGDIDMLDELFSTPEAKAEADSDARVMRAFVRLTERDPWLLQGFEGEEADMFRAGMGTQIGRHYADAKKGLAVYQSWRQPYPGANPDGTIDLYSGLPLDRLFMGLELPDVRLSSPSAPFTELAREASVRPRLKLVFDMAGAAKEGGEEAWKRLGSFTAEDGGPVSAALVGWRPLTDDVCQKAAVQGLGLIDRFIADSGLDFVIVNGMETAHVMAMDGASKLGTVMAGFPKLDTGAKQIMEKLESAGWRAGIGRIDGRLAVMAVKTGWIEDGLCPLPSGRPHLPANGLVAGSVAPAQSGGPPRLPTAKWDGKEIDPALAPTGQFSRVGSEEPSEYMIGGGGGGRVVEDIIRPFSPRLRGVLNGPLLEKLLKATPDRDEAAGELAGLVYKLVFLQGITAGEGVVSRLDMVAGIAKRMKGAEKMEFGRYEEGHIRLFAEVFDGIISAYASPERRRYAEQLSALLAGSGRDIQDVLHMVGRYAGQDYPSIAPLDSVHNGGLR